MSVPVFKKLRFLVDRFGREVTDDSRRCEALLRDLIPENRREIAVLVGAAKEMVCKDLCESSLPAEYLFNNLTERLNQNLGIELTVSRWAVSCWAYALRVECSKHFSFPFRCPCCLTGGKAEWRMAGASFLCPNAACRSKLKVSLQGTILTDEVHNLKESKIPIACAVDTTVDSNLNPQTPIPLASLVSINSPPSFEQPRRKGNVVDWIWDEFVSNLQILFKLHHYLLPSAPISRADTPSPMHNSETPGSSNGELILEFNADEDSSPADEEEDMWMLN